VVSASGEIPTTFENRGYRTVGYIGDEAFQIVGCQTVSNAFGSISTTVQFYSGLGQLVFEYENFDSAPLDFRVVITADLAFGNDTRPRVFSTGYSAVVSGSGYSLEWYGDTARIGDYYPELGTVNDSVRFGDERLVTDRDSAMSIHVGRTVPAFGTYYLSYVTVYTHFLGGPVEFEVREVELPSQIFSLGSFPVFYRVAGTVGHGFRSFSHLTLGNLSHHTYQEYFDLTSEVLDKFTQFWLAPPSYGNWSLQFSILDDDTGTGVLDPQIFYFNYLSPEEAKGTPRPTGEDFTESYERRKFRIRGIFQYAYMIPILVN
jgi:hypothetical protein